MKSRGLCAELAAQRMSAPEKSDLQEIHRQALRLTAADFPDTYLALNHEFHDLICAGAHNATIENIARSLRARLVAFRQAQSGSEQDRMERSNREHDAILSAIIASQPEPAGAAMRRHNARLSAGILRRLRL